MARLCSICSHLQRSAIDKRIAAGDSVRKLAEEFGLPKSTLHRHKVECAGLKQPPLEERREPTRGTIALASLPSREQLGDMYAALGQRISTIVDEAERQKSLAVAIQGLSALRGNLDSLSKLAGHTMPHAPQVQVNVAIDAGSIAQSIIEALTFKGNKALDLQAIESAVADDENV